MTIFNMKCIIFCIILLSLHHGGRTEEIDVSIKTENIDTFLRRLLSRIDNKEVKSKDIKVENKDIFASKNKDESLLCTQCEYYVDLFEMAFNYSLAPEQIQQYFLPTCDILKKEYRSVCIEFYQGPGLQMIKDILKNLNATTICRNAKLCTPNSGDIFMQLFKFSFPRPNHNEDPCTICISYFIGLEELFDQSRLVDFDVQQISSICNAYKTRYQNGCRSDFSSNRYKLFLAIILNNILPIQICQSANACPCQKEELKWKVPHKKMFQEGLIPH